MSVVHFEQLNERIANTARELKRENAHLTDTEFLNELSTRAHATEEEVNFALRIHDISIPHAFAS